jgi:hypothetical protein
VRKDTCPHGCGLEDSPDAIFDHKGTCLKKQDQLLAKASWYIPPHGERTSNSARQILAKRRLGIAAKFQTATSLKRLGRASSDTFQKNSGEYNYCYGSEDRRLDEKEFSQENMILEDLEKGILRNPYL